MNYVSQEFSHNFALQCLVFCGYACKTEGDALQAVASDKMHV